MHFEYELRKRGAAIDVSTLDCVHTRWRNEPDNLDVLIEAGLVDTISTDFAVAERRAWAPLNPDGVTDPSGPGRSNELAGKTCISSPAIRARGGTYAADSARSIASGSLSITVRRIREGVSILERPCSQSRTRATENP